MKFFLLMLCALLLIPTFCAAEEQAVPEEETLPELTIVADGCFSEMPVLMIRAFGAPEKPILKWSSSDEKIAEVDESGRVRGIAPGEAVIRCECVNIPAFSSAIRILCVAEENIPKEIGE